MILNKHTIFVGIAMILGIAVLALGITVRTNRQSPQNRADDHKKIVEAIRHGGLREAAKIKGHYVGIQDPNWDWTNFTVEALTKASIGVVVGSPEHAAPELSSTGDSIDTHFVVRISEVIKGGPRFSVGDTIFVSVPGGNLEFDDGTSAEVQTPGYECMALGKEDVSFRYQNRNGCILLF